jgi:5-methyltetrahydropteroyltriglutamate--homocysteine methyltransferase
MQTHILGFPRIGAHRELKRALENHWRGQSSPEDLLATGRALKKRHWDIQADLSFVSTGDFSFYDHVLDTTLMLGAIPERFAACAASPLDLYFSMARGDAGRDIAAMDMTKWFNTNYHYMVPELSPRPLTPVSRAVIDDTRHAFELGHRPKAVLLGPITYLSLAKGVDGFDPWNKLDEILDIYAAVLTELGPMCEWVQIDEPILCADMAPAARAAFPHAYAALNRPGQTRILLATYFEALDANLDLALDSGCAGLHLDLVRGKKCLDAVLGQLPQGMTLSAGLVEGRNIWKADLGRALATLETLTSRLGGDRVMVGSSCSLLHCPVDLAHETALDPEFRNWMAFATQKCAEIRVLGQVMAGQDYADILADNAAAISSRAQSPKVVNPAVRAACAGIDASMTTRANSYPTRKAAQAWLNLPLLPTTTIGSFPQTPEIRQQRARFRVGDIDREH